MFGGIFEYFPPAVMGKAACSPNRTSAAKRCSLSEDKISVTNSFCWPRVAWFGKAWNRKWQLQTTSTKYWGCSCTCSKSLQDFIWPLVKTRTHSLAYFVPLSMLNLPLLGRTHFFFHSERCYFKWAAGSQRRLNKTYTGHWGWSWWNVKPWMSIQPIAPPCRMLEQI